MSEELTLCSGLTQVGEAAMCDYIMRLRRSVSPPISIVTREANKRPWKLSPVAGSSCDDTLCRAVVGVAPIGAVVVAGTTAEGTVVVAGTTVVGTVPLTPAPIVGVTKLVI